MLDAEFIPQAAYWRDTKNGVEWYTDGEGKNAIHYMRFGNRILAGGWCGPRWVFYALTSMPEEERESYCSHDEFMGAITLICNTYKKG